MAGQAFAYERVNWKDESMIHDGRMLNIERQASNSLNFELYWFLPPIFRFQPSNFDEHRIEFRHPDTNERVIWSGERHFTPVRIDIIDGTPYLVIYGRPDKKTEKIYGCPELPYIYLKYQKNFLLSEWITISVEEAPKQLLNGNLSVYDFRSKNGRTFKWKEVERDVKFFEGQSSGQMQATIPRSYDEWHTKFKNSALNERMSGDCRPPRTPLPQAALPNAIEGKPELLETINYTPDRIAIGEEWTDFVFDSKREGGCKKLFRPTDPNDYMQGQRFVKDSSGNKPAPYSRTAQFNMGVTVVVLPDAASVRAMLLSDDTRSALKDKKILNASTTKPDEIAQLERDIADYGGILAETSIMIGPDDLRTQQGQFILGCQQGDQTFWSELLTSVGKRVDYAGVVGDASKAEVPILIASMFGVVTATYAAAAATKLIASPASKALILANDGTAFESIAS